MLNKDEGVLERIHELSRDIDMLSLNDAEGWRESGNKLVDILSRIPQSEMRGLFELFTLCAEGIGAISEKGVKDFSLVEAVSDAITVSAKYVSDHRGDEGLLRGARAKVEQALVRNKSPEEGERDEPGEEEVPSELNDLASLLVQSEPDDISELSRIHSAMQRLSTAGHYPESLKKYISEAADLMNDIIEGRVPDREKAVHHVGRLIEDAMERKDSPPEPSKGEEGDQQELQFLLDDADHELLGEFVSEAMDLISKAEEALLTLETKPEDMDSVGMVFRAFHTIKGNAAFLELSLISEMAHLAENLLSRIRDGEIRYTSAYADLSLRALDMLKELIGSVQNVLEGEEFSRPEGLDDLIQMLSRPDRDDTAGDSEDSAESVPRIGDILVAQGSVERETVERIAETISEQPIGIELVKSKAASAEDIAKALRTQERMKGGKRSVESSIRVSTSRLDRLIDMVGELVIAHSIVAQDQIVVNCNKHDFLKKISQTSKIVRELQDLSMSMRMIPLKGSFQKMSRLVRDVARKLGKDVHLVTKGEETEIDRNMVDVISDPLMHMVRNAIDHGIEPTHVRKEKGKPEYGTLELRAYHSAGSVVVEIKDDGQGIDRNGVLAKARERGILNDGDSLSDREVYNLIFEPGFSTATSVTDVSGRGVGMDVVKKNIESLRGQVDVQSEVGQGTVFKVSLPLTLAIIDGMVVSAGSERYIIPTVSIVRSLKPAPGDVTTVLHKGEMLSLQGRLIPLFRLARLYDIQGAQVELNQALIVVVQDGNDQAGLLIDELIGRQQIVIKSLGEMVQNVPGVTGGAIMPNGRVGLILDVAGLIKLANSGNGDGIITEA